MGLTKHAGWIDELTVSGTKRLKVNASNRVEVYASDGTTLLATVGGSNLIQHTESTRGLVAVNDTLQPAWPVPAAGTLSGLRVTVGAATVGGSITVRVDRVSPSAFASPVDITVAVGEITTATTPTLTVAAGDLLTATVTALTATNVTALSIQFVVSV